MSTFHTLKEGTPVVTNLIEKSESGEFKLPIAKKEQITHDTILFTLGLPDKQWVGGCPVSQHFFIHDEPADGEEEIKRLYSPVSPIN